MQILLRSRGFETARQNWPACQGGMAYPLQLLRFCVKILIRKAKLYAASQRWPVCQWAKCEDRRALWGRESQKIIFLCANYSENVQLCKFKKDLWLTLLIERWLNNAIGYLMFVLGTHNWIDYLITGLFIYKIPYPTRNWNYLNCECRFCWWLVGNVFAAKSPCTNDSST